MSQPSKEEEYLQHRTIARALILDSIGNTEDIYAKEWLVSLLALLEEDK
jgi:hypothetical protein